MVSRLFQGCTTTRFHLQWDWPAVRRHLTILCHRSTTRPFIQIGCRIIHIIHIILIIHISMVLSVTPSGLWYNQSICQWRQTTFIFNGVAITTLRCLVTRASTTAVPTLAVVVTLLSPKDHVSKETNCCL